jgi:tetratricopeptide (TPR) repeat protein
LWKVSDSARWLAASLVLAGMAGCRGSIPLPPPGHAPPVPETAPAPESPAPVPAPAPAPTPRVSAAAALTQRGETLLARGQADAALHALEQAVSLDAYHGPAYYHLVEAWLQLGDVVQAEECHRLARLYLEEESGWARRLASQGQRLERARRAGG